MREDFVCKLCINFLPRLPVFFTVVTPILQLRYTQIRSRRIYRKQFNCKLFVIVLQFFLMPMFGTYQFPSPALRGHSTVLQQISELPRALGRFSAFCMCFPPRSLLYCPITSFPVFFKLLRVQFSVRGLQYFVFNYC